MKKYDAIIIGAGPMGIFTAYELMHHTFSLITPLYSYIHIITFFILKFNVRKIINHTKK